MNSKKVMKLWKYKVLEYEVKKMTDNEIEYSITHHKTNSKLLFYLIILCLKISRIKYKTIVRD